MNNKKLKNDNNSNSSIDKNNVEIYQSVQTSYEEFDQPVILRQSPIWSRVIVWSLIAVTVSTVGWAYFTKIEQVVQAVGKLEPIGKVQEVQAPVDGVIEKVFVEDGDPVEKDEVLMRFDTRSTQAELKSLQSVRQSLIQENNFYRTIMSQSMQSNAIETEIIRLDIPQEVAFLTRNRTSLVEETQFLQALLPGSNIVSLNSQQQARLNITKQEADSRIEADKLEIDKLQKQLSQNESKKANAQSRLATETEILNQIEPLARKEVGAIAQLQYTKQIQEVENIKAELYQIEEEEKRINLDINQKQNTRQSTEATYERDTRNQLATNQQRIAEIDSQLTKIIVENEKQITDIDKQIKQMDLTLEYQYVKAPISGTVFDLKASPNFVASPNQTEPLLKIVPEDQKLIAEVFVTNKDIGFIEKGKNVDVRIDTYPFSEFGDIDGKVILVGSDALPPDQINQYYRFPVKIQLEKQYLPFNKRKIPLQSGMSISVNIKVNENRTVLSLLTEQFVKGLDKLKGLRSD